MRIREGEVDGLFSWYATRVQFHYSGRCWPLNIHHGAVFPCVRPHAHRLRLFQDGMLRCIDLRLHGFTNQYSYSWKIISQRDNRALQYVWSGAKHARLETTIVPNLPKIL